MSGEERREARRWRRLFLLSAAVFWILAVALLGWAWQAEQRVEVLRKRQGRAVERSLEVSERCVESLKTCNESFAVCLRMMIPTVEPVRLPSPGEQGPEPRGTAEP